MAQGVVYVQEEDPGAVGFGNEWRVPSTGNCYVRNPSNSAWTYFGNANQVNGGFATKDGFTLTGALTGPTGWAPSSSPDFTTSLTIAGVNAATVNDLSALRKLVDASMDARIAEQMAVFTSAVSINDSFAFGQGIIVGSTYDDPIVVPAPQFTSDGTTASSTNSTINLMITPMYAVGTGGVKYRNEADTEDVTPALGVSFIAYHIYYIGETKMPVTIRYLVVAQR